MSLKNKKYFCYEIDRNISLISFNNKVRYQPCSFYDGEFYESDGINVKDARNSSGYLEIKNLMEKDQPIPGCSTCYKEEAAGRISRRQNSFKTYENYLNYDNTSPNDILGLDYCLGNVCNLKCVICKPNNTSGLYEEFKKIYPEIKFEKYDKHSQSGLNDKEFLNKLKLIHFHGGGEPLLSNNHTLILKQIDDLSDVRVFYNINATVRTNLEVLQLWKKCKLVEIYFSIDAIGKQFDYQRTNGHWEEVVDNIKWFKKMAPVNVMLNINCTWSALNIYYLDAVVDWKKEMLDTNRVGDPVNLLFQKAVGQTELTHIRPRAREQLVRKYEKYPELLNIVKSLPVIDKPLDTFNDYIQKLDNLRNDDYKRHHSEWAELL